MREAAYTLMLLLLCKPYFAQAAYVVPNQAYLSVIKWSLAACKVVDTRQVFGLLRVA